MGAGHYDAKAIRATVRRRGYVIHIPRKGEHAQHRHRRQGRACRWVVERHHFWTNRARRLLIRWEEKSANYLGFGHLQFALIAWRAAGVLV